MAPGRPLASSDSGQASDFEIVPRLNLRPQARVTKTAPNTLGAPSRIEDLGQLACPQTILVLLQPNCCVEAPTRGTLDGLHSLTYA